MIEDIKKFCDRMEGRFSESSAQKIATCRFEHHGKKFEITADYDRNPSFIIRVKKGKEINEYYSLTPVATCIFEELNNGFVVTCLERGPVLKAMASSLRIKYDYVKDVISIEMHDKDFEVYVDNDYR